VKSLEYISFSRQLTEYTYTAWDHYTIRDSDSEHHDTAHEHMYVTVTRHNPDRQNPDRHNPDRQNPDRHNPDRQNPDRHNRPAVLRATYLSLLILCKLLLSEKYGLIAATQYGKLASSGMKCMG
jgi:hypothetical protein